MEQSDSEFSNQEYLGLYPTLEKMEDLPGYLQLGFQKVTEGSVVRTVPLVEAVKGRGVIRLRKGW